MAATTGIHTSEDVLKMIMAGADVTHLCSVLLQYGPGHIATLEKQMTEWLEQHEYESVAQMKGSVSKSCAINPAALEHNNYLDVIKSYDA